MKGRAIVLGSAIAAAFAFSIWLNKPDLDLEPLAPATLESPNLEQIKAGEYLVQIGNCVACHTDQGGAAFAGGRAVPTPFGEVYSSNLTSDDETGLGRWTNQDFYRAMRHGRSKDDRWLSPAFPYTSYTNLKREDSDAMFAWLQTLPPIKRVQTPDTLRFPYGTQLATRAWRALYFKPATTADIAAMDRGRYLVEGLGHCAACHTSRGALGGSRTGANYMGGEIGNLGWDALPLVPSKPMTDSEANELGQLLKTGINTHKAVAGPMSEVVFHSLQHLNDADLAAIVATLRALPPADAPPAARVPQVSPEQRQSLRARGKVVYAEHCADCHGDAGEGRANIYPALAGNANVNAVSATNALNLTLNGGFPPSTAGNPFPYGMPPFSQSLSRPDVAAVLTYIRSEWGNDAPAVSVVEVERR
ncbi:cytochrome c [uncultured Nevskia sp.]|uniref:cytochrome c n=1 Tax=uncultured Nevskia sp. TaxID=228950 RepID=UPI0025E347FB|nr:cytochrome c [uncultured Nevskia sp.]